jgi:tetratricopeptide (TPR) repeat protein
MKHFLIAIIFLSFPVLSKSQFISEVDCSKGVCECIESSNRTADVEANFRTCFLLSLDRHKPELMQEVQKRYGDLNEKNIMKLMDSLYIEVGIKLIGSCKSYFTFMDSLMHQSYKNLNKDSLKNLLHGAESVNIEKKDKKRYEYISTLYFQLGDYNKAMENSEKILSQDSTSITALFIKASFMDSIKNYQEAIIFYDKVAKLSHQNSFYIYSAIARRKKNGLSNQAY